MITLYKKLVNLLNSKEIGTVVSRKEIISVLSETVDFEGSFSVLTVDCYKRMLTSVGFLTKVGFGKYRIECHIGENYSLSKLKDHYHIFLQQV